MKERPILFNGEMVRAIQEGRKTQTRRVVKPSVKGCTVGVYTGGGKPTEAVNVQEDGDPWTDIKCPYGIPGDRLWVRETWFPYTGHGCYERSVKVIAWRCSIGYKADMKDDFSAIYRPSIHMPRWASRILLEITGVRMERVQDISEEDAKAEGIDWCLTKPTGKYICYKNYKPNLKEIQEKKYGFSNTWNCETSLLSFQSLWNSIYEKPFKNETDLGVSSPTPGGLFTWDKNPWVWVVEFKVLEPAQT